MPSLDANGKRIPGHAQRLRKAAREAPDPPAKSAVKKSTKTPVPKKDQDPSVSAKKVAQVESEPDPDLYQNPFTQAVNPGDLDGSKFVSWSARLHVIATYEIAMHPEWYPNKREWMRELTDKTSKFGAIKDRAAEQEKMAEVLRRDEVASKKAGLVSAHGRTAPKIPRPAG